MRTLLALLPAALLAASCASPYKTRTQSWGDVDEESRGKVTAKAEVEEGEKLTPEQFASRFQSSAECEYEAREQYKKSPKRGLALLGACLKRSDFIVLDIFWSEPWAKLFKDPHRFVQIARVIGNRGGTVSGDLLKLQQNTLPVYSVEQALEQPKQTVGRIVIARGLYMRHDKEHTDKRLYQETKIDVERASELAMGDGRLPSVGDGTGRFLVVEERRDADTPAVDKEYVIVGEVTGVEDRFNEETGEEQRVVMLKALKRVEPYGFLR